MLTALLALGLFAAPARVSRPSIDAVSGSVQVGQEPTWKDATVGMTIGAQEFVRVEPGASVTIQLVDGRKASFVGRAIVPGRRLVPGATAAGASVWLAQALQRASDAVVGKDVRGEVPGGAKPLPGPGGGENEQFFGQSVADKDKLHQDELKSHKNLHETGNDAADDSGGTKATEGITAHAEVAPLVPPPQTQAAPPAIDRAEGLLASGDLDGAKTGATAVLAAKPDPLTAGRAHLVLGSVAADRAELQTADRELTLASGTATGEWLAAAHARRGIVLQQLGKDAAAAKELEAAIAAAPASAPAAQAWFYLGAGALAAGRGAEAKADFGHLAAFPALQAQADELLKQTSAH